MEFQIDPYNEILFEFEDAMHALEAAYVSMRAEFDVGTAHYLRLKRKGADEDILINWLIKLRRIHEGLRLNSVNLQHVLTEHRLLIQMIERQIEARTEARGSP